MPVCESCDKGFPNWATIDGVSKNLCNRKYCLSCSPWGEHNTKKIEVIGPESKKEKCTENSDCPVSLTNDLPADLHNKKKGNIGELATALTLSRLGYSVFTELGDVSSIDLIAEIGGRLIRIQCKAMMPVGGALRVPVKTSTRSYKYDSDVVDYIAACDLSTSQVYMIPVEDLEGLRTYFTIRLTPAANGQIEEIRSALDYLPEVILNSTTKNKNPG